MRAHKGEEGGSGQGGRVGALSAADISRLKKALQKHLMGSPQVMSLPSSQDLLYHFANAMFSHYIVQ